MEELEKYGTKIDGMDWEIDLERKRLVCMEDPKLIRKLNKVELKRIREIIKNKNIE